MLESAIRWMIVNYPGLPRFLVHNFRKSGFDIIRGIHAPVFLLKKYDINLILDVGANVGQFARWTRAVGYSGRVVSFEPLTSAYAELSSQAKRDALWATCNIGLSDYDGEALINVSRNSVFSSILNSLPSLNSRFDGASYVSQEKIEVRRLDSIFNDYYRDGDKAFLKIDVQGFERRVLSGAKESLRHVCGIQLELSFIQLYENEPLLNEMVSFLAGEGFMLAALSPLQAETLTQADGFFYRQSS